MICSSCNGKIELRQGKGRCISCGTAFDLNYGFNETEVAIINDESIKSQQIAEKIYYHFDKSKIKVFQKKLSSGGLSSNDQEGAIYQAVYYAKIVIIVGTTKETFEKSMSGMNEFIGKKSIIPVFYDMDANELPTAIRKYQAQNFDKIAALSDLTIAVEKILGRKKENHFNSIILYVGVAIVCITALAVVNLVHGNYIRKEPNRDTESGNGVSIEQSQSLTEEEIYVQAKKLYDDGKYLEACEFYNSIQKYKDVSSQLKLIYGRYDGYYQTEDLKYTFYINVSSTQMAKFSLEKIDEKGKITFTESAEMKDNIINAEFQDSEDGRGTISIKLFNDSLEVNIAQESTSQTIGNLKQVFLVENKKDRPMEKGVTSDVIYNWLDKRVSLKDIKRYGYEVSFENNLTAGGGTFKGAAIYGIINSDYKLLMFNYDLKNTDSYWNIEANKLDDYYLYAVIAPAELLLSDYSNYTLKPMVLNEHIVVPSVSSFVLSSYGPEIEYSVGFEFSEWIKQYTKEPFIENKIKANTLIGIVNITQLGEKKSNSLLLEQIEEYKQVYN